MTDYSWLTIGAEALKAQAKVQKSFSALAAAVQETQQRVEWGVRYDDGRVEHCSEATAHLLAAPGVTPVSRVVGPWQDTTPNPPTGD